MELTIRSLIQGSIVRVNVGVHPEQKTYFVHKALLCHYSEFFQAALNSPFVEGKSTHGVQTVALDEESPTLFDRVYNWLYSGTVLSASETRQYSMQPLLVELWILADRRAMPALQNDVLDAIDRNSNVTNKLCEVSLVHSLFNSAPRLSKARLWVVEQFTGVKNMDTLFDRDLPTSWDFPSKEFLAGVARRSNELLSKDTTGPSERLKKLNMCAFHEHREGENCKTLAVKDAELREGSQ